MHKRLNSEVEILVHFALQPLVFEIQGRWKLEMHGIAPNWTPNNQMYFLSTEYFPQRPKFWSALLYDYPFLTYKVVKNWKWLAVSEIQGSQKLEMHQMTPNWTWTHNGQKYSIYTKYLPLSPNLVHFALWLAVPEIQGRQKSEVYQMIPNLTLTLNNQKYSVYTKYLPRRPNFSLFRSTISVI